MQGAGRFQAVLPQYKRPVICHPENAAASERRFAKKRFCISARYPTRGVKPIIVKKCDTTSSSTIRIPNNLS